MTETSMPSSVISNNYSDNIISLMYTLQTGIYLQDEDTGEIISASDISSISTDGGDLNVVINSRSLDAASFRKCPTPLLLHRALRYTVFGIRY